MGKLIDINQIRIVADTSRMGGEVLVSLEDVRRSIAQTPTAIEIVRCKDCQYSSIDGNEYVACKLWNRWNCRDGYCDAGRKKDGASGGKA